MSQEEIDSRVNSIHDSLVGLTLSDVQKILEGVSKRLSDQASLVFEGHVLTAVFSADVASVSAGAAS